MKEVLEFKKKLNKHLKIDLELHLNENRSTMLNILERNRYFARLSIHKMFLNAPDDIILAIARYVRGVKEKREEKLRIRGFIQKNLENLDYSSKLDKSKFVVSGKHYNLKTIYDDLNATYFQNKLNIDITWYGRESQSRSKIIFGQYIDQLKLIKIHRILDNPFFPPFFVSFVVFHEMVHHVVPGFVDEHGLYRTHGKEFKEKEKMFKEYERATFWEKRHKEDFFQLGEFC